MTPSASHSAPDPGSEEEYQARIRGLLSSTLPIRGPVREARFDPERIGVLFFCRGRGRGHAIPDVSIIEALSRLRDDLDILFVSYAMGADTLVEFNFAVIDLGLPEENLVWDTTVLAGRLIRSLNPSLVVAHEEFAALVATGALGIPAVFITHWFLEPEAFAMQTLHHADDIIFIDHPGQFEEPPHVAGRVHYVGPVVRDFTYDKSDRRRCRDELGISANAMVITLLPGSWTEEMAPTFDLVIRAIQLLPNQDKKLLWVAGEDYHELSRRTDSLDWVTVIDREWQIDRLMVASDLVITKANRNTVVELGYLAIPSISLTYNLNPMDDLSIANIPTNTTLEAAALSSERLAHNISKVSDADYSLWVEASTKHRQPSAAAAAANIIDRRLQNVLGTNHS